jgi:hypothetical protein
MVIIPGLVLEPTIPRSKDDKHFKHYVNAIYELF